MKHNGLLSDLPILFLSKNRQESVFCASNFLTIDNLKKWQKSSIDPCHFLLVWAKVLRALSYDESGFHFRAGRIRRRVRAVGMTVDDRAPLWLNQEGVTHLWGRRLLSQSAIIYYNLV